MKSFFSNKSKIKSIMHNQIILMGICFSNFIANLFPDTWLCSRFFRPFVYRLSGVSIKKKSSIRKKVFFGNPRHITIGQNLKANKNLFIDAFDKVDIGDDVLIGPNVSIISSTHDTETRGLLGDPVRIEDKVWIGANVVIGPGVIIGTNSIISAGSVVMRSCPSGVIMAGNPARKISTI